MRDLPASRMVFVLISNEVSRCDNRENNSPLRQSSHEQS